MLIKKKDQSAKHSEKQNRISIRKQYSAAKVSKDSREFKRNLLFCFSCLNSPIFGSWKWVRELYSVEQDANGEKSFKV